MANLVEGKGTFLDIEEEHASIEVVDIELMDLLLVYSILLNEYDYMLTTDEKGVFLRDNNIVLREKTQWRMMKV